MPRKSWSDRAARQTRLTGRGWVFLVTAGVLFICAYSLARPSLLFVAAFVAAIPLLSILLVRFQRLRLDVRRSFSPSTVIAGRPTTVNLFITNLSSRQTAATLWRDECGWAPALSAEGTLRPLRSGLLRGREPEASVRLIYETVPPRRGVFSLGPFIVTVVDPFALARGTQVAFRAQTITVVPDAAPLPASGLEIAEAEGSARLVQHRAVGGDHDITTRAYRNGDALRRVHWRASAHHGDLMVRQEEQRSHSEASVLLDTRRDGYQDYTPRRFVDDFESDAFEWAVTFAASLVVHLQRSGFVVHLHETADPQLAPVEHGTEFLESLATVSLREVQPSSGSSLVLATRPGSAPGSIFAVVSNASPEVIEALRAARSTFELAVAFVVMPLIDNVSEPLKRIGWACIAVEHGTSAQSAWLSVMAAGKGRG